MDYKTPGVKIRETRVFGKSIPTNDTAIPVFIGYTQNHAPDTPNTNNGDGENNEENKSFTPYYRKVNSLREYTRKFGGGYYASDNNTFYLYESIKLYFANGGSTCYIISVGNYDSKATKASLKKGIELLPNIQEGNLVLMPDAVLLDQGQGTKGEVYNTLLEKCSATGDASAFSNQFALLDAAKDLTNYESETSLNNITNDEHRAYGAMYHPWLKVPGPNKKEIEEAAEEAAKKAAEEYIEKEISKELLNNDNWEASIKEVKGSGNLSREEKEEIKSFEDRLKHIKDKNESNWKTLYQKTRDGAWETKWKGVWEHKMKEERDKKREEIIQNIQNKYSLIPPSGAIAGAIVRNDTQYGIQKAPANITLQGVKGLQTFISDADQKGFNAPGSGKAINCIRAFVNNGIKVWGARTLAADDLDYRYVNVRRTMNMLEQSIKSMMEGFVFENNNERTWLKIRATLGQFLKRMLNRGVLSGSTPSEAYDFTIGMGETMTAEDINEGIMRLEVRVALARPSEFIEITFEQKSMEGAVAEDEGENFSLN